MKNKNNSIKIKNVAEVIRNRRKELGIKAEDVAEAIFLTKETYYRKEKGETRFIDDDLIIMCHILDLSLDDFIEKED